MNMTNDSTRALEHQDNYKYNTSSSSNSASLSYQLPINSSKIGNGESLNNVSQVLLQPMRSEPDLIEELITALDLYYTPTIIVIGNVSKIQLQKKH